MKFTTILALAFALAAQGAPRNSPYATINLFQSPPGMGYLSGSGTYYVRSTVTIATIPNNGVYVFVRWSDGNTNATRNIVVPKNGQSFTAYYNPLPVAPLPLTNATIAWNASPTSNVTYRVTLSPPMTTRLTFSTTMLLSSLTNGATYQVYVEAIDTNGLTSDPTCTLPFVAGSGLYPACP